MRRQDPARPRRHHNHPTPLTPRANQPSIPLAVYADAKIVVSQTVTVQSTFRNHSGGLCQAPSVLTPHLETIDRWPKPPPQSGYAVLKASACSVIS